MRGRLALLLLGSALLCLDPAAAGARSGSRRTPVVDAIERNAPATVNITTTLEIRRRANPFFRADPFFDDFFGRFLDPRPRPRSNLGSGVIIDDDGHVLTNAHVLAASSEIRVTLADGREFEGELIGTDPATDLAVLRILSDESLPAARLGSSEDLMIGETVIAIGNPFGLHHSVTTGVLSATNRSIRTRGREFLGFLQTDASINPGNSGGPLLNLDGEVIGINTAILERSEGIGFAIPIDRAMRIVDDLIRHGEVFPVWLGIRVQELNPALRRAFDVDSPHGVLVSHVFSDAPAEQAGVRVGDVMAEMNGNPLESVRGYFQLLATLTEGDTAKLVTERDGKRRAFKLRGAAFPEHRTGELARVLLGFSVGSASPGGGLVLEDVAARGPAGRIGLRNGDVLLKVDREIIEDAATFHRAVARLRGRSSTLLLVRRGRTGYHVTLQLS